MILIPLLFVFVQPVSAALKKCKDDVGMFHYYNKILPAECQGKATVEMNKLGVVIKRNEIKEEVVESAEDEKSKLAAERVLKEKERRDMVLLNIYTSEEAIDLARERNVKPVELAIVGVKKRLEIARSQLETLQKQVDAAGKAGSPALAAIKKDMIPVERDVANLENELNMSKKRIQTIQAKFDADKERFLQLMENKI